MPSCRDNQNTDFIFNNFFVKIVPFMRYVEKYCTVRQARRKYSARALQAGYLRLQTHTQNAWNLSFLYCYNCWTKMSPR